jgi:hypothetical protein
VTLAAGLLLALASTAALNSGFFMQQQAAARLPALSLRAPLRSLWILFRHPRWTIGFLLGISGWALYVAALALAPLSLVQSTSAGGIGLLALLARTRVRREQLGVALSMCGLVLLGVSLSGGASKGGAGSIVALVLWLGCSAVHGGARLAFVPVLLACHGLAFVSLQLGFQRGGPLATAGVATLLTNALPIAAGFVIFTESLPGGILGALRVVAFVLVVLGAAALGTRGTAVGDSVPAQALG